MKRKQLKELPLPQKLKSTKHVGGKKFNRWGACALYSSNIDESTGEEILIIDLFDHQSGEFERRFFFSADNWFSINEEKESSSAQIMSELCYGCDFKPITKVDSLTVKEFFSENKHIEDSNWKLHNPSGIDLAQCFCEVISEERRERGRCNTKSRTERELAELKKPPKGFFSWIDKTATAEWKCLFTEPAASKDAKTQKGYCACCGQEVEVERVKIGEKVRCPNCKTMCNAHSATTYLNLGVIQKHKNVSYIEPLKGNRFCLREFWVDFNYWIDKSKTGAVEAKSKIRTYEFGRWVCAFDENGELHFEKGYKPSNDSRIGEWRKSRWCQNINTMIYPRGLNKLFRAAPAFNMWHIDYEKIVKSLYPIDPINLYVSSKDVKCFYNLFTNRFMKMTREVINNYFWAACEINKDFGSLKKALDLNKDEIIELSSININLTELRIYKKYRDSGRKVIMDDLIDYLKISGMINAPSCYIETITKRSSLFKFNQYVNRQIAEKHIAHIKRFVIDYEDYLRMAERLEYNISDRSVLFPNNFKKAHDTVSKTIIELENKRKTVALEKQYKQYKQLLGYEDNNYVIVPPSKHTDIVFEGQELHHCVASYVNRVISGATIILFIRKKDEPDKPFYTLNLDPKDYHQIQCRGLYNCDTTKEIDRFLAKYRKEVISKLKRSKEQCKKTA